MNNSAAENLREEMQTDKSAGWRISYIRADAKGKWLVYSGRKSDQILYVRAILACDGSTAAHARFEYPAAKKKTYDSIVTRLARSLRFSKGKDCS